MTGPMTKHMSATELSAVDVLARTIWGEARGEAVRGKEAVAAVIMNRVIRAVDSGGRFWWGTDVTSVCRKPYQFSCWNEADPNRKKLLAVKDDNKNFQTCKRIARRAMAGTLPDPTGGATHYHAKNTNPHWARGRAANVQIGQHLFYSAID